MAERSGSSAGLLARQMQKKLSRAQEKVLQKLGKIPETKDERFEQAAQNFYQQQAEGQKLNKDLKHFLNAVKVMHENSMKLSQTLQEIYSYEWEGYRDLKVISTNNNLLWEDYEEKLADQVVRTVENYIDQFSEVKEKISKRSRKLVDYDSARHHLETAQNAKKKDEVKTFKAEEEFIKAQAVFEDLNRELLEELPLLYNSRIGCYVTIFQNISSLQDVFHQEMSKLNRDLYEVMSRLEKQYSSKVFVVKGVSKKRSSLVISSPVPRSSVSITSVEGSPLNSPSSLSPMSSSPRSPSPASPPPRSPPPPVPTTPLKKDRESVSEDENAPLIEPAPEFQGDPFEEEKIGDRGAEEKSVSPCNGPPRSRPSSVVEAELPNEGSSSYTPPLSPRIFLLHKEIPLPAAGVSHPSEASGPGRKRAPSFKAFIATSRPSSPQAPSSSGPLPEHKPAEIPRPQSPQVSHGNNGARNLEDFSEHGTEEEIDHEEKKEPDQSMKQDPDISLQVKECPSKEEN